MSKKTFLPLTLTLIWLQVHLSPAGPDAIFVMWATQVAKVSSSHSSAITRHVWPSSYSQPQATSCCTYLEALPVLTNTDEPEPRRKSSRRKSWAYVLQTGQGQLTPNNPSQSGTVVKYGTSAAALTSSVNGSAEVDSRFPCEHQSPLVDHKYEQCCRTWDCILSLGAWSQTWAPLFSVKWQMLMHVPFCRSTIRSTTPLVMVSFCKLTHC